MISSENLQSKVQVGESNAMEDRPNKRPSSVVVFCAVYWKALIAEFLATGMLMLFGCMACIPLQGITEQSPLYGSLAFGLVIMFNIQIFGHISGANMNPAVTLSGMILGKTSIPLGICYVIVQLMGATAGYGLLVFLSPTDVAGDGICVTQPFQGTNIFQTMGIEMAMTGALALLCCSLWDPVNEDKQDSVPIKFGLTITGLSMMCSPFTGSGLNPARSFAPAFWSGVWHIHWVYWAGPLLGAAITTIFYKIIFLKK